IAKYQGSLSLPTGNKMDHFYCPTGTKSDFYIDGASPIGSYSYFYQTGEQLNNNCFSTLINQYPALGTNDCESELTPQNPISDISASLSLKQSEIDLLENEFDILKDGGNTEYLLTLIENLSNNNFNQTCTELLNSSPYLSDTVLSGFMSVNINGHADKKRDVLVANSPLPENAKQKLDDYWLPPPFKSLAESMQTGINPLEQKQIILSSLKTDRDETIKKMIAYGLYQDSIPEMEDSIIDILLNENSLSAKHYLVPLLIDEDRFIEAQAQINEYSAIIANMPEPARLYYEENIQLMGIAMELKQNPNDTNIIINNLQLLQNLAEQVDVSGNVMAQVLLEQFYPELYDYPEIIVFPEIYSAKSGKIADNKNDYPSEQEYLIAYPNPANTVLYIDYMFEDNDMNIICLYSIDGRKVIEKQLQGKQGKEVINIESIHPGIYYLKSRIAVKQIVVMK
ncbi:MAG: T9SS type A sorting domain-containing protein, partial [Bacteroidota bacterium]